MKLILKLIVIGLLLMVAGCANEPDITVRGVRFSSEHLSQGQQLYTQYCASCHGANGEGQFPDAPNFPDETGRIGAPPHNGNGHTSHHSDEWLIQYIREGGISLSNPASFYPMPAFGDQLSNEQIALVIAHIKTIWNEK